MADRNFTANRFVPLSKDRFIQLEEYAKRLDHLAEIAFLARSPNQCDQVIRQIEQIAEQLMTLVGEIRKDFERKHWMISQ